MITISHGRSRTAVTKTARHPEALEHLRSIPQKYEQLRKMGVPVNPRSPRLLRDKISIGYLAGETLQSKLERALLERDMAAVISVIEAVLKLIQGLETKRLDLSSFPGYSEILGPPPEGRVTCLTCGYLDLLPDNIIESDGRLYIIDYEWTFDFPLSRDLVLGRFFLVAFSRVSELLRALCSAELPMVEVAPNVFMPQPVFRRYRKYLKNLDDVRFSEAHFQHYVFLAPPPGQNEPFSPVVHTELLSRRSSALAQARREVEELSSQKRLLEDQLRGIRESRSYRAAGVLRRARRAVRRRGKR